jgi:hypothetical protein
MAEENNLDDMLDSALDAFDDDEEAGMSDEDLKAAVSAAAIDAANATDNVKSDPDADILTQGMAKLMEEMQDPEFAQTLQQTFQQLSSSSNESGGLPAMMNPFAVDGFGQTESDFDKTIAATLSVRRNLLLSSTLLICLLSDACRRSFQS